jgi:hypothetical protein
MPVCLVFGRGYADDPKDDGLTVLWIKLFLFSKYLGAPPPDERESEAEHDE